MPQLRAERTPLELDRQQPAAIEIAAESLWRGDNQRRFVGECGGRRSNVSQYEPSGKPGGQTMRR